MASSTVYCEHIKGNDDFSQFHIAACKGDVVAVKKFIEKGINIDKTLSVNVQHRGINNRFEFNALHTALLQYRESSKNKDNYMQIIKILVENGINTEYPFRKTKPQAKLDSLHNEMEERRPLTFASNDEIIELLRKGGAKTSPLIFIKQKDNYKFYKGEIIVSGTIEIYPDDDEWFPGALCMFVDKGTSYLIPRDNSERTAWFCLDDDGTLFTKLKIDRKKIKTKCFSGFAKIQITNYRLLIEATEAYDSAKLVKVIEMKNYSYKKCPSKQ